MTSNEAIGTCDHDSHRFAPPPAATQITKPAMTEGRRLPPGAGISAKASSATHEGLRQSDADRSRHLAPATIQRGLWHRCSATSPSYIFPRPKCALRRRASESQRHAPSAVRPSLTTVFTWAMALGDMKASSAPSRNTNGDGSGPLFSSLNPRTTLTLRPWALIRVTISAIRAGADASSSTTIPKSRSSCPARLATHRSSKDLSQSEADNATRKLWSAKAADHDAPSSTRSHFPC